MHKTLHLKPFFPVLYIITKTYDPKLGSGSKSQALMNKSFHCIVLPFSTKRYDMRLFVYVLTDLYTKAN